MKKFCTLNNSYEEQSALYFSQNFSSKSDDNFKIVKNLLTNFKSRLVKNKINYILFIIVLLIPILCTRILNAQSETITNFKVPFYNDYYTNNDSAKNTITNLQYFDGGRKIRFDIYTLRSSGTYNLGETFFIFSHSASKLGNPIITYVNPKYTIGSPSGSYNAPSINYVASSYVMFSINLNGIGSGDLVSNVPGENGYGEKIATIQMDVLQFSNISVHWNVLNCSMSTFDNSNVNCLYFGSIIFDYTAKNTIANFQYHNSGTKISFDIYTLRTNGLYSMGGSKYNFIYTTGKLGNPITTYVNPKYTAGSPSGSYSTPFLATNSNNYALYFEITFNDGSGEIVSDDPGNNGYGEKIATIQMDILQFTDTIKFSWNTNSSRIVISDGPSINSIFNGSFNSQIPLILNLTQPNGGEYFNSGTVQNIIWTNNTSQNIKIELTTNFGNSWSIIHMSYPVSIGYIPWTVPNISSNQSKIRISDISNSNIGDTSDNTFTIIPFPVYVSAKLSFEGMYIPLLNLQLRKDSVTAYIHQSASPYNIIDSANASIDSLLLTGLFKFYNTPTGTYYISIKHLNSIETWSKSGGEYLSNDGTVYNYDFTFANSQAYGNNLILKGNKHCFFSGDVNQDGYIALSDVISIYNDASNFITGRYLTTDLTGDNIVDLTDVTICYNNSANFISIRRP